MIWAMLAISTAVCLFLLKSAVATAALILCAISYILTRRFKCKALLIDSLEPKCARGCMLSASAMLLALPVGIFSTAILKGSGSPTLQSLEGLRSNWSWILLLLLRDAVIMPIIEEYLFRGYIMGFIGRHIRQSLAIITCGLLFALAHYVGGFDKMLLAFFVGVFLGIARFQFGINWAVSFHAAINGSVLLFVFLFAEYSIGKDGGLVNVGASVNDVLSFSVLALVFVYSFLLVMRVGYASFNSE